jgi:hypothetical protein
MKGSPHSPQNFLPLGFSDPHFEQRIDAPANQPTDSFCSTQRRLRTSRPKEGAIATRPIAA